MSVSARDLMRRQVKAALGTSHGGAPYVSLVLVAFDATGAPLLLLSDLAQHTQNLKTDPRLSLLFDGAGEHADPLIGPRLTVLGVAERCKDAAALERYVASHPSAAMYSAFTDFNLHRVIIASGHFVAGFGRIEWVAAEHLLEPA